MILVEKRLKELFNTLPEIEVNGKNYKPQFDFGSHKDLLKFLNQKAKEGGTVYPLIWLETPIEKVGKENRITVDLKLVLATLTNSEISNIERLNLTFGTTLVPLYKNVLKALQQSGFTQIRNKGKNKRTDFFNYGVKENENQATDVWDAIKFECDLEINNCPLRQINY